MSIDILKEDIKNNKIKSLYLFYGQEDYLKKYYTDNIEKSIVDEGMKALNMTVLDGRVEVRSIVDACETMPVFSERKLIIVKNSGLFKAQKGTEGGQAKRKSQAQGEDLPEYLKNIPGYVCLIFNESEIDKRVKLVDAIKKNGLIVEFPFQKPAELVKWVTKVFKSNNKSIDPITAGRLVDSSEQGMTEILNEINKVVLYLGERTKVLDSDIESVCTKSIKGRIFDLTDAIAEKDGARAIKLLNDMIALREPLPRILFMIARQFRHVLEMKLLSKEGVDLNTAASKIGVTPYAAGKILRQGSKISVEDLRKALEESLELDSAIKSGRMDARVAVELIIGRFGAGK